MLVNLSTNVFVVVVSCLIMLCTQQCGLSAHGQLSPMWCAKPNNVFGARINCLGLAHKFRLSQKKFKISCAFILACLVELIA